MISFEMPRFVKKSTFRSGLLIYILFLEHPYNTMKLNNNRLFIIALFAMFYVCDIIVAQTMNKKTMELHDAIVANHYWEEPKLDIDEDSFRIVYGDLIRKEKAMIPDMNSTHTYQYQNVQRNAKDDLMRTFYHSKEKMWENIMQEYPEITNLKEKQRQALKFSLFKKIDQTFQKSYASQVDHYVEEVYSYFKKNHYFSKYHYSYREYLETEEKRKTEGLVPVTEAVDLGLSVKWAPYNVSPDPTDTHRRAYYAWGETKTISETYSFYIEQPGHRKDLFNEYDYVTLVGIKKYCLNKNHRYDNVDKKTKLDPEDDVAQAEWGATWRMPTAKELKELKEKCRWVWTYGERGSCDGYTVYGPNGNSIFLPANGHLSGSSVSNLNLECCYWSSSLILDSSDCNAYSLDYWKGNEESERVGLFNRDTGKCIRAVCPK